MPYALPYWRLSTLYFFYYAVLGVWYPFWGLYLQTLGYGPAAIGALFATILVPRAVAPYVFNWLCTEPARRLPLVQISLLCSCLCFSLLFLFEGTLWLALITTLTSFFWCGAIPQIEALTLEWHREREHRYSLVRLWGSFGFIVTVSICGVYFQYLPILHLPILLLLMLAVLFLSALATPRPPAQEDSAPELPEPARGVMISAAAAPSADASPHFSRLAYFFAGCCLLYISHGTYNAFYSIYLEDIGYSRPAISALWSLGVIAEVLLFLVWPRLLQRFRLEQLLLLSGAMMGLRWLIIGFSDGRLPLLVLAQLLHGAYYCGFHASAIEWLRRIYPGKLLGRGQALYHSLSFGLGGAIGTWSSGWLWQLGVQPSFMIMVFLAMLGMLAVHCARNARLQEASRLQRPAENAVLSRRDGD